MYWLPVIVLIVISILVELVLTKHWIKLITIVVAGSILTSVIVWIDYDSQTTATEIWSGKIEAQEHTEEWDEWIPPQTTCTTDAKGNSTCTTTPGYWVHHPAVNKIKTSDNGWFDVDKTLDGRVMDDSYPNTTAELARLFPIGTPSASFHTYVNKVQASYSIYKHRDIDLSKYPDLPDYPMNAHDYIYIDRIIGNVPNKENALDKLASLNAELNKTIPDPNKKGSTMSWKQVNLIFVNVGDNKPQDYGIALQDKWKGGNKNDFIVAFSMDKDGKLNWVYPFSWSEVEILKLNVRDYMMDLKQINDFTPVVQKVGDMIAKDFVRKQFADFNYLHIDISNAAIIWMWVVNMIILVTNIVLSIRYKYLFE